jgi:hypothetical protein
MGDPRNDRRQTTPACPEWFADGKRGQARRSWINTSGAGPLSGLHRKRCPHKGFPARPFLPITPSGIHGIRVTAGALWTCTISFPAPSRTAGTRASVRRQ